MLLGDMVWGRALGSCGLDLAQQNCTCLAGQILTNDNTYL